MAVDEIVVDVDLLDKDEIIANVAGNGTLTEEYVIDSSNEDGKMFITLPAKWNKDALVALASDLTEHGGKRGIQTFIDRIERYTYHIDLCEAFWEQMEQSVRFLAGTRADSGMPRQSSKTPEKVAYAFYNTLNTAALRMQCTLFQLDYNSYDSVDSVINALVAKQVEMMSVEG